MTGEEVMNETCLPPQEAFYSSLTETSIDDEAYEHALQMWHKFGCKTFKDYHDLYLKLDVMLLADVFENFRMQACESYDLDPLHYLTLKSFSWDACLKVTRVQLDLMDTPEKFLMIENNIRGEFLSSAIDMRKQTMLTPTIIMISALPPPSSCTSTVISSMGTRCGSPCPLGNSNFYPTRRLTIWRRTL